MTGIANAIQEANVSPEKKDICLVCKVRFNLEHVSPVGVRYEENAGEGAQIILMGYYQIIISSIFCSSIKI